MMTSLKKFLALSGQQRLLLLRSFAALAMASYRLSRRPFKQLTAGLELHRNSFELTPLEPGQQDLARTIGWAIRTAARYAPWQCTCLVQVLAAQRMLQARGIGGEFLIGAAREEEQGEPGFQAHAWLTCGDTFITGEAGHERFTVVSRFRWV